MKSYAWLIILFIALSPLFAPSFWIHVIILLDYFQVFNAFDSPLVESYHSFLLSRLPDRPEGTPPILFAENVTKEQVIAASRGYTFPIVIRGIMSDTPAMNTWNNLSWWIENYGNESVLCKYFEELGDNPACTVSDALSLDNAAKRLYISGESKLFVRRPELKAMVESDAVNAIQPGTPVFTQLFMGYPGMGSDVHMAAGCNLFRQIAGHKKWWLIPNSQTPYLKPSLNPNGFSAHTKTKIGKGNEMESEWLKKVERYVVTLNPGDLLLNPSWIWHGVRNMGDDPNSIVIGVPTRYSIKYAIPAFKNNWLLTIVALVAITKTYGFEKFISDPNNLQNGIESARKNRAALHLTAEEEEFERQLNA